MNFGKLIDLTADRYPSKTAVIEGDRRLTYAEWNERIDRFANGLAASGLSRGEFLLLSVGNRIAFFTAFFAAQKLGCTPVPISTRASKSRLNYYLDRTEPGAVVYDTGIAEHVADLETRQECDLFVSTPDVRTEGPSIEKLVSGAATDRPDVSVADDDGYCLWHTSGSTGDPKGVLLSQEVGIHRLTRQGLNLGYRPTDVALPIAPFYHLIGSEGQALPVFMLGGTVVFLPEFDPERALELIDEESVTVTAGVPTQYNRMLRRDPAAYDLSSLRVLHYAGEPMTESVTRTCMTHFTDRLYQVYGTTEILDGTCLQPENAAEKIGSCGLPTFNTELRIVSPTPEDEGLPDPEDTVERGEPGEVIVSTDAKRIVNSYWKSPEATAEAFRDGWFYTRDVARRDEDGYFYIVDRADHMILSGGEKIYPREIEETLQAHPDVIEVAVVGVSDDDWGERVKAYVVGKSIDAEALDEYCLASDNLERWKRPREYEFLEELPRTASGKVSRKELG